MAVPKAKLLALFAVAMMVVSMTCIAYAGEDSNADSDKKIVLGTKGLNESYFRDTIGATFKEAKYDYSNNTGTLTINDFSFVTTNETALFVEGDVLNLVIEVKGNNIISTTGAGPNNVCINRGGDTVISGEAGSKLTLVAGDASTVTPIQAKAGTLTIKGGLTLDITAGSSESGSCGILANDMIIEDSIVSITSGNASNNNSCGLSVAGTLSITGANAIVKSKGGAAPYSTGALIQGNIAITGATVEFEGGPLSANGSSMGLSFGGKIIANHANIKAIGGSIQTSVEDDHSCGIAAQSTQSCSSSFADSVITAVGGEIKTGSGISNGIVAATDETSVTFTRCTFVSVIGYDSAFSTIGSGSLTIDDYQSLEGSSTIENPSFGAVNESNLYTLKYIRSVLPELTLDITSPTDGSTVSGDTVEVTGTTNGSSVTITVNGTDVGKVEVIDGSFSKTVTLSQGKNTIIVTAENIRGETLSEEIEVTYGASQSGDTNPAVLIVAVIAILAVAGIALYPRKN